MLQRQHAHCGAWGAADCTPGFGAMKEIFDDSGSEPQPNGRRLTAWILSLLVGLSESTLPVSGDILGDDDRSIDVDRRTFGFVITVDR